MVESENPAQIKGAVNSCDTSRRPGL